jgi:hypothetical protein
MLRPHVYCEFNDWIDEVTFGLRVRGTLADLECQQVRLISGLELTLIDYDVFKDGSPAWIAADAVVAEELYGLPTAQETVDPAWLTDDPADEGWNLLCTFSSPPLEQGSPSSATVRFLVDEAPHNRLGPGATLRLFERATQRYAAVDILD